MLPYHGGVLRKALVNGKEKEEILKEIQNKPEVEVDEIFLCDMEMMAIGAFSPVDFSFNKKEYESVIRNMRLPDGIVWTFPIVLRIGEKDEKKILKSEIIKLTHRGRTYGCLYVDSIYDYDPEEEALKVYGTTDISHPSVRILKKSGRKIVSGKVKVIERPLGNLFPKYNRTPEELRNFIKDMGWKTVVGFQTRNPVHRAHEYIQKCALEIVDALLINPLVGLTKEDDIPAEVRMKCYEVLIENYFPKNRVILSIYHGAMRYGGPREAILHAITRKNYGCTHFIVGRDHAGVSNFYGPYDAQKIFEKFEPEEIGITPLFFENTFFCTQCSSMASSKTCPHENSRIIFSGTKVREMLVRGETPPPEFSRKEVIEILKEYYSNRNNMLKVKN